MAKEKWIDHYAELELIDPRARTGKGPESTPEEIKQKRNAMVKRYHPDRFPQGTRAWRRANEKCMRINITYEVLQDPESKLAYDEQWLKRNPWFVRSGADGAADAREGGPSLYAQLDWEEI